jgi:hypothetical protein
MEVKKKLAKEPAKGRNGQNQSTAPPPAWPD